MSLRSDRADAQPPPPVLGRLEEGATAGPTAFRRAVILPTGPTSGLDFWEAGRPDSDGLATLVASRSRAIAWAVSSSLRSGRWLGGLRFGMAGDSLGKTTKLQYGGAEDPRQRQVPSRPDFEDASLEIGPSITPALHRCGIRRRSFVDVIEEGTEATATTAVAIPARDRLL
jgi:hypothetical protein